MPLPRPNSTGLAATSRGRPMDCKSTAPAAPSESFLVWFFVQEWNRFMHICARTLQFTWLEDGVAPRASRRRAMFAGDEIPDPPKR
jgi:hypothetical protein